MKRFFMILAFVMATTALYGQSYDLKRFPEGCEPQVIGEQLVKHYLETPHSHWGDINSKYTTTFVTYPDVCTWLGSLWFATATKNEELYKGLVDRFEPLFGEQKNMLPEFYPKPHNVVDWYVFGAVPLEIYKRVKDQKYLDLGLKYADLQWVMPENPTEEQRKWQEQDYSWQTRLWIDDMFMITAVQAQAYLVTGDEKYMDRASREMVLYLDSIQRPNGLFHHASNVPYFWGRGDGWMAVGMAEMLRMMPKDNPYKERVMESYKLMMKTLLRYQGYDGMWTQIIDDPNSWKETSSTAMFTYAMIVGVKNGWLDKKTYGAAARKAYISLLSYLDENWNIRNVCEGTGARNNYKYYLTRRKLTGDLHGQAALIWCCYALSSDVKPYKMTKQMVGHNTIRQVWIFPLLICILACNKPEIPSTPEDEGNTPQKVEAYNLLDFSVKPIAEPISMGRNLAERFIEVRHSYWGNINSSYTADHITYPDVCAWLGAFWWAEAAQDQEIFDALVAKFDLLFTTEKHLQPNLNTTASNKVDYYVFGALPLHIYQFRKEQKYLDLGLKYADGQWKLPSNASSTERQWHNQGYSWQTRLWIDDMFMITALQAQAYLATKDEKYLKRLLDEMLLYIDRLPGENGLYYHASNAPYFWGRGNGWMAVGMTEVLRMLPDDPKWDTYREPLLAEYRTMMDALVKYQIYTGLWAQLVDHMTMWEETSGSAMFTYALISGVKNGWLEEKKYGTAARKGWLGLMDYLNSNYDIRNVCEGTGAQNSYTYYSERRKWVGDTHGQAGMLWCSFALTELAKQAKTLE